MILRCLSFLSIFTWGLNAATPTSPLSLAHPKSISLTLPHQIPPLLEQTRKLDPGSRIIELNKIKNIVQLKTKMAQDSLRQQRQLSNPKMDLIKRLQWIEVRHFFEDWLHISKLVQEHHTTACIEHQQENKIAIKPPETIEEHIKCLSQAMSLSSAIPHVLSVINLLPQSPAERKAQLDHITNKLEELAKIPLQDEEEHHINEGGKAIQNSLRKRFWTRVGSSSLIKSSSLK